MADDDEEGWVDADALPVRLPAKPSLSPFGPAGLDYAINKQLQARIPTTADTAIVDVKIRSDGEERILTGIVAAKIGNKWGLALGGMLDLDDNRNWEVEIVGVVAW